MIASLPNSFLIVLLSVRSIVGVETNEDGGPSNIFLVKGQELLLPEVPSILDFRSKDFVEDESDIDKQMELRDSRFWGRVYVQGWPSPIQYMRAQFGRPPPYGQYELVVAEPLLGCTPLVNQEEVARKKAILLVQRGECMFADKARIAVEANASALLVVNDRDGIEHVPGPSGHDLNISVSMISQAEGKQLIQASSQTSHNARIIPINCKRNTTAKYGDRCAPTTVEEREFVSNIPHGGYLHLHSTDEDSTRHPYLLAEFGVAVPTKSFRIREVGGTQDACHGTPHGDITNSVAIVLRGNCSFYEKAINVMKWGGVGMILINTEEAILRMGVQPTWMGRNVSIPLVMVGQSAREDLQKLARLESVLSLTPSADVREDMREKERASRAQMQGAMSFATVEGTIFLS